MQEAYLFLAFERGTSPLSFFSLRLVVVAMGFGRLAGLASAGLAHLAMAEDLLFYDSMTYQEYTEATTVLGYTGEVNPFLDMHLLVLG